MTADSPPVGLTVRPVRRDPPSHPGPKAAFAVPPSGVLTMHQVQGAVAVKALVKEKAEPGLWLMDVPEPEIGPGDVLIKVLRTGICGTDLHIRAWDGWAQQADPHPAGRSATSSSARSSRPARDVADIAVGDLVSGEGHLVCGKCRNCLAGRRHLCRATVGLGVGRDGAFAEYVALPAANVWVHRVPVDLDVAAIFDPFGNAVHTALSFPLVGEDVLITGAGPDRHHGRGRRPARRAPATSSSPTSARSGWSWPARSASSLALNVAETDDRRRAARAGPARGLRHRPGDVRPPRGACAT